MIIIIYASCDGHRVILAHQVPMDLMALLERRENLVLKAVVVLMEQREKKATQEGKVFKEERVFLVLQVLQDQTD